MRVLFSSSFSGPPFYYASFAYTNWLDLIVPAYDDAISKEDDPEP